VLLSAAIHGPCSTLRVIHTVLKLL
jgi:hypothetical protein